MHYVRFTDRETNRSCDVTLETATMWLSVLDDITESKARDRLLKEKVIKRRHATYRLMKGKRKKKGKI